MRRRVETLENGVVDYERRYTRNIISFGNATEDYSGHGLELANSQLNPLFQSEHRPFDNMGVERFLEARGSIYHYRNLKWGYIYKKNFEVGI